MSFISFLFLGSSHSKFEQYKKGNYKDNDSVVAENTTHQYSGITDFDTGLGIYPDNENKKTWRSEYLIDGAVRVNTIFSEFSQKAIQFWKNMYKNTKIFFVATLIILGAAAITSAFYVSWPIVVTISVVALIILGIAIWKACEANKQLKEWQTNNTIEKTITDRREIGIQGFHYAYSKNLKGIVATKDEVQALWFKEIEKYEQALSRNVTGETIRTFMEKSPFSQGAVLYANENNEFDGYSSYFSTQLLPIYNQIRSETNFQKNRIREQKETELSVLENKKEIEVRAQKFLRDLASSVDTKEREHLRRKKHHFLNENEKIELENQIRILDRNINNIEAPFNIKIAAIEAKYFLDKKGVENNAESKLTALYQEENQKLLSALQTPILNLLKAFRNRNLFGLLPSG